MCGFERAVRVRGTYPRLGPGMTRSLRNARRSPNVRILVDLIRCQSYGQCIYAAPSVFRFNGELSLEFDYAPDDALREQVERAVAACPVQAIRIGLPDAPPERAHGLMPEARRERQHGRGERAIRWSDRHRRRLSGRLASRRGAASGGLHRVADPDRRRALPSRTIGRPFRRRSSAAGCPSSIRPCPGLSTSTPSGVSASRLLAWT